MLGGGPKALAAKQVPVSRPRAGDVGLGEAGRPVPTQQPMDSAWGAFQPEFWGVGPRRSPGLLSLLGPLSSDLRTLGASSLCDPGLPPSPAAPCLPGLPPTLWRNFLSLRVAESTELSSQRAAHHPPRPVPCAQPQRVRDDRLTIIKPARPDFPARQRGPGPSGTKYANHLGPGAQSKGQEIPWVQ